MKKSYLSCLVIFIIVSLISSVSWAKIDPKTVVGLWLLDDGGGNTVKDFSGNSHSGKIIGNVNWVEGKSKKALEFPGTLNDYVEITSTTKLEITTQITLMAWIKTTASVSADIVGKDDGSTRNYNIHVATSGKLFLNGGGRVAMQGTTSIIDGNWHHVAGTWDGKDARIYIDGKEEASMPYAGPIDVSKVPVKIGLRGNGEGVDRVFTGSIDEVAIFNVGLSEEDIQNLMNNGLEQLTSVDPINSVALTWGRIKAAR